MHKTPKIWSTLLLAAVLTGALSFVLPKNHEKYLAEHFWTRKTFAQSRYDVVLMGDSRVYRGLSPEVMQDELPGLRILNFAYSNGGLNPTMFRAAESKLNNSSEKKVIVMGVAANTITEYTENNMQFIQELSRPREEIIERLYFGQIKYWFSPTSPEGIKELVRGDEPASYYTNEYYLNGYVKSVLFPPDTMRAIPSYIKDFTHYKVDNDKLESLFSQISTWTDDGIVVLGFRPPVSHPMYMLEDTMGLYNEAAIKAGFIQTGGYWLDLNHTDYKTYDGSHLKVESAVKLSRKVGSEIKSILQKP